MGWSELVHLNLSAMLFPHQAEDNVGISQNTELCARAISLRDCPSCMPLCLGWDRQGSLCHRQSWAVVSRGVLEVLLFILFQLALNWPSYNPFSAVLETGVLFYLILVLLEGPRPLLFMLFTSRWGWSQYMVGMFLQPPSPTHQDCCMHFQHMFTMQVRSVITRSEHSRKKTQILGKKENMGIFWCLDCSNWKELWQWMFSWAIASNSYDSRSSCLQSN